MSAELNMPVFVIGLERLKAERYQRVLDDLARIGVDASVWPAVDGLKPIKFEPGEAVARFKFYCYAFLGRGLLKTEIGCYLSHWRLWKHAFEKQNYERIVALEDDAVFDAARFKEALANIAKLDQSFEYINLRRRRRGEFKGPTIAKDGRALYASAYWGMLGTYGYSISRRGFKKLAPALTPINKQVDRAIRDSSGKVNLRVWAVFPGLCYIDESVASAVHSGGPKNRSRRRARKFVKFAFLPLRVIYEARIIAAWQTAQRDATGGRATRFARAKTLTATLLQVGFKATGAYAKRIARVK